MGLGLLGRGVGEAAFLAECGAKLIITDLKTREQLKSSLTKLRKYKNIKFVLGEHRLEDFSAKGGPASGGKRPDFILKAASVPLNSPYIAEARRNKIPVEMSASLFTRLSDVPVIGVTGTRGKSTVAHLIFHILKTAGKRAVLGGNVLGVSNLPFLKKADELDFAVLELDSWQLQGFGESRISPHIAVFTTFYPDHMNYYGNKMKRYFDDKALIFSNQKKGDILVAGKQALSYIKRWGGRVKGKLVVPSILPREFSTQLLGAHNEYNVALAVVAARSLGVNDDMIKKAIRSFKGVPYRLELVRTVRGIKIYNDTTATTPEATIAALRALGHSMSKLGDKRIVLIMGGSDKGLDMSGLVKEIPKYCKVAIFLSGTGTEKLKTTNYRLKTVTEYNNLKDAVYRAIKLAKKGGIILFSPAFASFGMFKNEYDRGDKFVKLVKKL